MFGRQPPKPTRTPGTIDFEPTDFAEARQALDELPAGLAEMHNLDKQHWDEQRRKSLPSDRALTGAAMDWVIGLEAHLRPRMTCEQFPRVINAIAQSWPDTAYSVQVLDHMINDYRGGRRGFPAAVQQELSALLNHQRALRR